ncbi:MAG: hypothetical protein LUE27_11895 [Clostridia bacterium]|nr:hypothetical protein [Clostridia bacterium]
MDFFQYANIVDAYATFETRWLTYLVGGLCYAVVYVFLVVALYIIAKREGYKNKWMIFIPILNTFYIGVCSTKNKLFGTIDARIVSAICAALELLLVVANILYYVSFESLISGGYLGETLYEDYYYGSYYVYTLVSPVPDSMAWMSWCYFDMSNYVTWWLDILYMVLQLSTLILFFKTYAARRYLLFSITGVLFPIQGILAYTVKGNKGYNYNQFMKKQQELQYQAYQQQMRQNPNYTQNTGNPYSSNPYDNPYSQKPGATGSGPDDDPFGGAGAQGGSGKKSGGSNDDDDPFAEFGSSSGGGSGGESGGGSGGGSGSAGLSGHDDDPFA